MIIKCDDGTPIELISPKSRKKIWFTCDKCGKEWYRGYNNYIKNKTNLCRSCISIEVNSRPDVLYKNKIKQLERWKTADRKSIGKKISLRQKENWKNGRDGKPKKYSYDYLVNIFEKENYILLTTESNYTHHNIKLKYRCPNNHFGYTDINHWMTRKQRCGKCAENFKLTHDYVKTSLNKEGYKLLSTYKHAKHPIKFICPNNHTNSTIWSNWKKGHRCSLCAKNKKIEFQNVISSLKKENYQYISGEIKNSKSSFTVKCNENHSYKTNWNVWNSGKRCPTCYYNSKSSKAEQEIQNFISQIYNGTIINNDRNTILNPETQCYLELDVYLPEINKAIEYNGVYWHNRPHQKANDKIKQKQCKEKNINLLIINEENYMENKEMCLEVIENFVKEI